MTPALTKPLILSIDSALNGCAVAILDTTQNKPLAAISRPMSSGQAEHVVPMIEQALKEAGAQYADIGLIAVVNGPGAFTGIRIGIATAKALGLSLHAPIIGVSTFEAVLRTAFQNEENRGYARVTVILETKRTDFYVQEFDGEGTPLTSGKCASAQEIRKGLTGQRTLIIGDGVDRILGEWETFPSSVVGKNSAMTDPVMTAEIGKNTFLKEKYFTEIKPVYLRPPDVTMPKTAIRQEK